MQKNRRLAKRSYSKNAFHSNKTLTAIKRLTAKRTAHPGVSQQQRSSLLPQANFASLKKGLPNSKPFLFLY
jgi:hypothetical protein